MKNTSHIRPGRSAGFTLLEMVIVLGIIALIIGGAMGLMGKVGEGAKVQRVEGDFNSITSALKLYKVNNGTYPTQQQGIAALVTRPTSSPEPRRWTQLMASVPKDPWGNEYGYLFPGRRDKQEFELVSKGADGVDGGPDDMSSQDPK